MFQEINFPAAPVKTPEKTSMIKRIAAITFIFLCTAVAWAILGATIFDRTYDSSGLSDSRVQSTWGASQSQSPPQASFEQQVPRKETKTENGKTVETVTQEIVTTQLPLESSHIDVDLNLEHRQKGLLWYSTYKVGFDGGYSFRNTSDKDQNVSFRLDFPTAQAIYDDRALERLPVLADALEEAGCTDAAILEHCRGPGPHVRGCWVIDLLLGKE